MGKEMDLDTALSFSRQVLDQYRAYRMRKPLPRRLRPWCYGRKIT